jgi:hypothetical protein
MFIREGDFGKYIDASRLDGLEIDLRLESPLRSGSAGGQFDELTDRMRQDDEFALDVIDWMLHHAVRFGSEVYFDRRTAALNALLQQGGSAWEVTKQDREYRLTRRAVGPVREVLEETAGAATRAHHHLSTAWSKLVGRDPDSSGAYRESVRAVEAVAKPIILPRDPKATMGQMIPAMRDKPEKWQTVIGTVDDLRDQMEAVWKGQLDRHGTDDETVPLSVSQEEADAAFSTCLNLVRQFAGGHISMVDP